MPDNLMNRFPTALNSLEAMKMPIQMGSEVLDHWIRSFSLGFDLNENFQKFAVEQSQRWCRLVDSNPPKSNHPFPTAPYQALQNFSDATKKLLLRHLKRLRQEKQGERETVCVVHLDLMRYG